MNQTHAFAALLGLLVGWIGCGAWLSRSPRLHPEEWAVLSSAVKWYRAVNGNDAWDAAKVLKRCIASYIKWRG